MTTVTVPCSMPVGTGLKPAASSADHFRRQRGGGDVDFADRHAEERIAHRAADHARLLAVAVEHGQQPRQRLLPQPSGIRDGPGAGAGRHWGLPAHTARRLLDMRRRVFGASRRAAEMGEHDEAPIISRSSDDQPGEAVRATIAPDS